MASYVQKGEIINYRNISDEKIPFGEVVVLSERVGVACMDIPAGALGTLALSGVYEMPAENTTAFTVGQTLYWDAAAKAVTATKAENAILAGIAVEPKEQAGATALVRL